MFAINKKLLTQRTHPEEWKWMESRFKEIRSEGKSHIVFKAYAKPAFHEEVDTGRVLNMPRRRVIGKEATFFNEEMDAMQSWAYAPNVSGFKNEHGSFELKEKGLRLSAEEVYDVNSKDIELIFFLRYVSQNRFIKEVDVDKENRKKAEKVASEIEAKNLIYSMKSPIHPNIIGSEQPLRSIAISWGVSNTETMSVYTVMDELWNRVQMSNSKYQHTKRGFNEFTEEVLKLGDGTKRTTVILGIQKGILTYKDNVWYLTTKGGSEQILVGVPIGDEKTKDEVLIKYLLTNDRAYEAVELSVENGSGALVTEKLAGKRVRQDMIAECRDNLGWPHLVLNKKKNPELEDILNDREQYVPEK